jgi:hypothetical protein
MLSEEYLESFEESCDCDFRELFLGGLWDWIVDWDWMGLGGLATDIFGLPRGVSEELGFGVLLWLLNK